MTRQGKRAALTGAILGSLLAAVTTGHEPSPPQVIDPSAFATVRVTPQTTPAATVRPSVGPRATIAPPPAIRPTPKPSRAPKPPAPTPTHPSVADAKAYALARLGPTQYACLADIVKHEDFTWSPYDTNSHSGAYGIPQALPGSKMASAGADWRWNRITQVKWMIGYVDGRYGSACQAAAYRDGHGWY